MTKLENGKVNMKTVKQLNKLLKFILKLHKDKVIDYPTYCILQDHCAKIMNSVVEVYNK